MMPPPCPVTLLQVLLLYIYKTFNFNENKKKCKALDYDAVQSFKKIGLGWNMQSDEIKLIKERGLKTDNTLPILQGLKTRGGLVFCLLMILEFKKKLKKMPPIFDVESLLLLVDEGDLDGVSALVAHKGEGVVQTKDEWGLTSLHLASATGNEVRKILL